MDGEPGPPGENAVGTRGPRGEPGQDAELTEVHLQQIAALVLAQMQANPEPFRGIPGQDGVDGKSIVLGDLTDEEIRLLAKRLPPIYPQWIDNEGKTIDEIPGGVRLGQTMPLRLEAVLKNARP